MIQIRYLKLYMTFGHSVMIVRPKAWAWAWVLVFEKDRFHFFDLQPSSSNGQCFVSSCLGSCSRAVVRMEVYPGFVALLSTELFDADTG